MRLQARLVRPDELSDDDVREWRRLALRAAEPNVFFEPDVLLPAARHLERPGAVRLAVVTDGAGRWLACAPVRREGIRGKLRLPGVRVWTHDYSGLEVPLVDATAFRPAATALIDLLRDPRRGMLCGFTQLPADGPFRRLLAEVAGGAAVEVARYRRAALRSRPEFTYLDAMRPKRRQELSRMRRRLEEHHDGVEAVDMSADPSAVDAFLALEASGWKGRAGTAVANDPGHAAFFREACEALRRAGRLQVVALVAGGRPIAMKCNGISGRRAFGLKQAFDESMGAYSPGRLLDVDLMRAVHDRADLDVLDTIGDAGNATLNAMWPDRLDMATVVVAARGPLGRVAGALVGRRAATLPPATVDEQPLAAEPRPSLVPAGS